MNERIRELAKNAGFSPFDSQSELVEKFAELIIRECVQQCEDIGKLADQTNFGEMALKTEATANGCSQMIKWRFGVE